MSVGQKLFVDSLLNGLSVEQKTYCLSAEVVRPDRWNTSLVVVVVASYKTVAQPSWWVGTATLDHSIVQMSSIFGSTFDQL